MTLDSRLNSNFVILTNIYQFYLLAAIKTHAYVKAMNGGITRNETFIVSSIVDLTEYSHSLIYKRVSGAGGNCKLKRSIVCCLGFHAFMVVMEMGGGYNIAVGKLEELMRENGMGVNSKGREKIDSVSLGAMKLFGIEEFDF